MEKTAKFTEKMRRLWDDAHDFDPRDPMLGLTAKELSGPKLSRRATLRLLAAGGTLTAAHLMPGFSGMARAASHGGGGTLTCGWAGVAEIQTLAHSKIDQVLQFQVTSNVLSGLMHIDASLKTGAIWPRPGRCRGRSGIYLPSCARASPSTMAIRSTPMT
ncbi:MAG: hypothetical protein R3D85_12355 [Paracoccaceae bacterium]